MISFILLATCLLGVLTEDLPPQTPIIGIYTQTYEDTPSQKSSYIAASYVKFIEMSGAQVVPIFSFSSTETVLFLLSKINGVLFPGGGMQFSMNNLWTKNADAILKYAKQQNQKNNTFPIFATCLGFQLMNYLTSNYNNSVITRVHGDDAIIHPIHLTQQNSYLFSAFSQQQLEKASSGEGIFYYNHNFAVTIDTFNNNRLLKEFWKLTSWSETPLNEKFVASMQAKDYPFYAVQFHPEKNNFEWKVFANRSKEAIEVVQIMSNRFIEQARQNKNRFINIQEFMKASIYNYQTKYPLPNSSFLEIYIFNEVPRSQVQLIQAE